MSQPERRAVPRAQSILLVSYREDKTAPALGFLRTVNLSEQGMLLETPDAFNPGDKLEFQILLDFGRVANVEGRIVRFNRRDHGLNRVGIQFANSTRIQRKLLRDQVAKDLGIN